MFPPCTHSPDGRHNFNPHTGDCLFGCGTNQRGKTKPIQKTSLFEQGMERFKNPKPQPRGIYTELQDLVWQLMKEYGEPQKIKIGNKEVSTFGYYIGKLSKVPMYKIYEWRSSVKQGRDIKNPSKVFWWYYREWWKKQKKEKPP